MNRQNPFLALLPEHFPLFSPNNPCVFAQEHHVYIFPDLFEIWFSIDGVELRYVQLRLIIELSALSWVSLRPSVWTRVPLSFEAVFYSKSIHVAVEKDIDQVR